MMRTLENALSNHDLVTLRVIGEWWELDLTGADKTACVQALGERLRQLDLELEINYLPPEEANALRAVVQAGGQMPVGTFSRQYGEVRQMGPGRLEREEPWLDPISPAEALWYRGFLYRGYDNADASGTLVEYYYIPQEFYTQFPSLEEEEATESASHKLLKEATPPAAYDAAKTHAVDDLTTILAISQRDGVQAESAQTLGPYLYDINQDRISLLLTLGQELDLLRQQQESLRPNRAAVKWLKKPRETQLRSLAEAWSSSLWNELYHTPGIRCEGSGWSNEPILARTALLDVLPRDCAWYRVDDMLEEIKSANPDFQRPEGNYDTWYVRDIEHDVYLRGFESWDRVEGRLLRFLVEGPMSWLGLAEVGEGCYRLTERTLSWLNDEPLTDDDINVPLVVQPDAVLLVPYNSSRYQRFQAARIAVGEPLQAGQPYRYRLTPDSLTRAKEAGIQTERVLNFLQEASGRPVPASVRRGIERWSERGLEGRLQAAVILRVREASILDTLQSNPKTQALIGERLGDLAAMVRGDKWRELQEVTAQLGLLLDVNNQT